MAFWDAWFKISCQECGEDFKKEELVPHGELKVCSNCYDELEEKRIAHEKEVEERRRAEEEARAKLLDRPIETSGKPFGKSGIDGSGGPGSVF